ETVNMYLEVDPSEDNKLTLYRVDGKTAFLTLPTTPIYAMAEFSGVLYVVAGATLYKVLNDFSYTTIGAVDLDFDTTIAANNAGQVCFNSGVSGKAYVYDTGTLALTQITAPAFYGSPRVDYLDGYGVFIRPNTQQFYISNLNDFTTFNALDFASDEADPDNLVTFIVDHRELILFGERTSTVWFNSGDATFPLSRREGAEMEVGCAAALSVAKLDNTVFFLGRTSHGKGLVHKLNQYTPQIISNRGIEYLINSFERIDDAFAYTYQKNGHSFYVLTFPTANKTLVYDASIQDNDAAWSVRETYGLGRDRASCYAFAFGKHLVGDFVSGVLYELDDETHLDGDLPIEWSRTTAHIVSDYKRVKHKEVVLNFETGVGLEDGNDPLVYLTYSDDGGHSYITPREASLGVIGQRKNRVMWARLGNSRDRVYKVFGSEPVKTVLMGGYIDVEVGKT
ncbi:packaged DNA stabilization protein, partial [uncultured Agitococcus sp.]|uniref:packaged DNA stabilization protein n=1 Tax=uncultured Agitococcus sp. TaxID=1506599 RepID=UPI00260DACD0